MSSSSYILRYCYEFENGFQGHCLIDYIFYKVNSPINNEMKRYFNKENQYMDVDNVFFKEQIFVLEDNKDSYSFIKIELFPKVSKPESIVIIEFVPFDEMNDSIESIIKNTNEKINEELKAEYKVTEYDFEDFSIDTFFN